MIITPYYFENLNIANGDRIYVVIETGEGFTGTFQNEYDRESFNFFNNTFGKTEKIFLSRLQRIEKVSDQARSY